MRTWRGPRSYLHALAWLMASIGILLVVFWPSSSGVPEHGDGVILAVPGRNEILMNAHQARAVGAGRLSLPMPGRRAVTVGRATITYKLDRDGARRQLRSLADRGGAVRVDERPVQVRIKAPIVKQAFPSNCETAALEMLLASRGLRVSQFRLQDQLRQDGPLDPRFNADGSKVWGNPAKGFVGRAEGDGVAVGFGVYEKPLMELASRWIEPLDLSGREPRAIFARLLRGRAVLAWIGLSTGPYDSWRDPHGERVRVNYGEHTVLLRGLAGDRVLVNDPLLGESQLWSRQEFKEKWNLLGRRAFG